MESEERAAFFPRIFSSFPSFSSFWEGGNRPRTFNDPTLVNPSSYSYAHSTARRKQEAHAGRSPEHCRGTHHQSAKRARPPRGTGERQNFRISNWAAWRTLPFRLRHGQHATSTIFFWYGVVVLSLLADPARGFWSLWLLIILESVFFQQTTTTRTTTGRVSPLLPPPTLGPRCWVCVSSSSREPRWDAPCLIVVGRRQIQQGQRCWGVPQSDFRCYLPCSSGDRSSSSKWHERKRENKKNTSIFRVIDRYRCPSCFFCRPRLLLLHHLLLSYFYFYFYFFYCK